LWYSASASTTGVLFCISFAISTPP
jgi:hypothetical protein